jgi:hypothetical protein
MNSDIRNNMKIVLKKQVEKKCNKNGFVDEVYRIIEYSDGFMPPENFNACAIYNITYHCKLCCPIENSIIIGQIKVITPDIIIAFNGPIIIFIPKENIYTDIWNIQEFPYILKENNSVDKVNKILSIGNYVKIHIINKRINKNDVEIKAIGKLLTFATYEEIENFFGNKIIIDKNIDKKENDSDNENDKSNFIM